MCIFEMYNIPHHQMEGDLVRSQVFNEASVNIQEEWWHLDKDSEKDGI